MSNTPRNSSESGPLSKLAKVVTVAGAMVLAGCGEMHSKLKTMIGEGSGAPTASQMTESQLAAEREKNLNEHKKREEDLLVSNEKQMADYEQHLPADAAGRDAVRAFCKNMCEGGCCAHLFIPETDPRIVSMKERAVALASKLDATSDTVIPVSAEEPAEKKSAVINANDVRPGNGLTNESAGLNR